MIFQYNCIQYTCRNIRNSFLELKRLHHNTATVCMMSQPRISVVCVSRLHHTLHHNTASQHCIATRHHNTALQHCITTLHHNTASQHCITTLYSVHCTIHTVQCSLHYTHCTVFTALYTLYSVHCHPFSDHTFSSKYNMVLSSLWGLHSII